MALRYEKKRKDENGSAFHFQADSETKNHIDSRGELISVSGIVKGMGAVKRMVVADLRTNETAGEWFRSRGFDRQPKRDCPVGGIAAGHSAWVEGDIASAEAIDQVVVVSELSHIEVIGVAPDLTSDPDRNEIVKG